MRRGHGVNGLTIGIAVAVSMGSGALGQEFGAGRIFITPGDMVNAGLGRAQAAVRDPFSTTTITETAETIGNVDDPSNPINLADPSDLLADAINQLAVNAISQLLAVFINDFLTQIGLPAFFPTEFVIELPDLSGLGSIADPDQSGEGTRDAEVPDDSAGDPGTSGGRNANRPRG